MNKKELKGNVKKAYSSQEKRKMVEEIRSGMLSFRQSIQRNQVSVSVLQKWNRWYSRMRLLQYYQPKSSSLMMSSRRFQSIKAAITRSPSAASAIAATEYGFRDDD